MRYVHRWNTPIKVMVDGVVENWVNGPMYNPRHVPALWLSIVRVSQSLT